MSRRQFFILLFTPLVGLLGLLGCGLPEHRHRKKKRVAKSTGPLEAGYFYCPYIPLQRIRAFDETEFKPNIAFKTRYGMSVPPSENPYYKMVKI